ncbi:MAG: hypothetical protein ACKVII_19325 [Planctomycetales bacterium]|jgi:predicted small lipoprotein YifL
MKRYFSLLLMLLMTVSFVGCGGAPETDEAAEAQAAELESSPDYENEMMGGGAATTE